MTPSVDATLGWTLNIIDDGAVVMVRSSIVTPESHRMVEGRLYSWKISITSRMLCWHDGRSFEGPRVKLQRRFRAVEVTGYVSSEENEGGHENPGK